jgi:hypothetical protein
MTDPLAKVQIADYCCCGSKAHRGHPCHLGEEGARRVRAFLLAEASQVCGTIKADQ